MRSLERLLVSLVLSLLLGCLMAAQPKPTENAKRPNLLLVTFDTTRVDRLGCYGYREAQTPAIDRLAAEGVLFEKAYAQATQTLPNHCSLFTGLYPITHNVLSNGQRLSDEAWTLAEILRSQGYRTGAVVAAAPLMEVFNLGQGFGYYNDTFKESTLVRGFKAFLRMFTFQKVNLPTSKHALDVTRTARQWLARRARDKKPFFLWVHYFDPHHPYEFHPDFEKAAVLSEGKGNEYGEKEANYINEIEFADYQLGKLLDFMDRRDLTQNTLTVFTTDHGESLGEHSYRGHRQETYESIIRVPLILRMPNRLPAGQRLATPAMSIDVLPTVLRLLQIPYIPSSFQGKDLLALSVDKPRKIYSLAVKLFTKSPTRRSLIYDDLKFIEYDNPQKNALFDLREDPGETVNLLHLDPAAAGRLDWLEEIREWFRRDGRLEFSDFRMTKEQIERLKSLGYIH